MNDNNNTDNLTLFQRRFQQAISDSSTLPTSSDEEKKRSQTLVNLITGRINKQGGSIPLSEFMEAALFEPELGYYAADNKIFGAAGDFLTAPEISGLFGKMPQIMPPYRKNTTMESAIARLSHLSTPTVNTKNMKPKARPLAPT